AAQLDALGLAQLHRGDLRGGGGDLGRPVRGGRDGRGLGGRRGGLRGGVVHGRGFLRGLGSGRGGGGRGGTGRGGLGGGRARRGGLRGGRVLPVGVLRSGGRGARRRRLRRRLGGVRGGPRVGGGLGRHLVVGGEVLRPTRVDARGILSPLLAERVHEPLIRTELRGPGALCLL